LKERAGQREGNSNFIGKRELTQNLNANPKEPNKRLGVIESVPGDLQRERGERMRVWSSVGRRPRVSTAAAPAASTWQLLLTKNEEEDNSYCCCL